MPLQAATEADGIRVLQHQLTHPTTSQFLISTTPSVSPLLVAQRVKGRLQYILRSRIRDAFQRNYSLRSVGSANRPAIDAYIAGQLERHPMVDPRVAQEFREYQFHDDTVDLSQPSRTSHAIYWYNLHVVLVNELRYRDIDPQRNKQRCQVIQKTAAKKGHLLLRIGLLPDHLHIAIRAGLEVAPQDVVFSYMNNLAFVVGMKPILAFSYYVGTFGEYDLTVNVLSDESRAQPRQARLGPRAAKFRRSGESYAQPRRARLGLARESISPRDSSPPSSSRWKPGLSTTSPQPQR